MTATSTSLPTKTPIPTPTLNPQFLEMQKLIAGYGERFRLMPDGEIQDNGVVLPGLIVLPDGTVTMLVDGERITLKLEKIVFSDEHGFSYPGYMLVENSEWVALPDGLKLNSDGTFSLILGDVVNTEVTLDPSSLEIRGGNVTIRVESGYYQNDMGEWFITSEKMWEQEVTDWGVDRETVTVKYDVDGQMAVVDNKTNRVIYWAGYWNVEVLENLIIEEHVCKPTEWTLNNMLLKENRGRFEAYMDIISNRAMRILRAFTMEIYFIGGDDNCWAQSLGWKQTSTLGDGVKATVYVWVDTNDEMRYEQVFDPNSANIELVK